MIQYINGLRIANAVQMLPFQGIHLIVEGDRDEVFFNKFIDTKVCLPYVAYGKPNVMDAIDELNKRNFDRALGVIDKDFDTILNTPCTIKNIVISDYHDMEMEIVHSPGFMQVVNIHGKKPAFDKIEVKHKKTIREILLEAVKHLAFLKLADTQYDLGLTFKPVLPDGNSIKYSEFIDLAKLEYKGDDSLIKAILDFSNNKTRKPKPINEIKLKFDLSKKMHPINLKELCNGHDITYVLHMLLKLPEFGKKDKQSHKQLEIDLILAYDTSQFILTKIYTDIKIWEGNKKIQILNC